MLLLIAFGCVTGSFLLASICTWLALIPWRKASAAGAHWTERARLLYPARVSDGYHGFNFALLSAFALLVIGGVPAQHWIFGGFFGWIGGRLGGYVLARAMYPQVTARRWLRQFSISLSLGSANMVVFVGAILVMPVDFGWKTWIIAGGVLGFSLIMALGLGRNMLTVLKLIRPAPPAVLETATQAANQAGAPLRAVWLTNDPAAFAAALIRSKEMIFSKTAIENLTPDEFASVCAHEAAHLKESNWILAARIIGSLSFLPFIFVRPLLHQYGPAGLFPVYIIYFAAIYLRPRLSRKMERRADQHAVKQTADPATYAHALERLYQINQTPAVFPKRRARTHPDLYDRMVAAGQTPAYPKPNPPESFSWTTVVQWSALLIAYIGFIVSLTPDVFFKSMGL